MAGVVEGARRVAASPWVFDERERRRQPRLDEPTEAGWSFVVAEEDPDLDAIVSALEPLARLRGMAKRDEPLRYPSGADRGNWIDNAYKGLGDGRPRYLLLAGDPSWLPYSLQVDLAAAGTLVGRISFSGARRLDDLRAYVDKVVRVEEAQNPVPTANAVVFATDGGPRDPTFYSRRFMASPVSRLLRDEGKLTVTEVVGQAATKEGLLEALDDSRPALLFTATHGAGQPASGGIEAQRESNGAWGCAPSGTGLRANDWNWMRAGDLPAGALAPGGAVIMFACWGYGTSDHSSFSRWLGGSNDYDAAQPFVAAIPQRMLANPDGPIAFVGHVDMAVLHGFDDPAQPAPADGVHPRLQPLLTLVRKAVVEMAPVGFAMRDLHERAAAMGSEIASTFDGLQQAGVTVGELSPSEQAALIDKVIRRNDAMHFLVLGDPAARVRVDA